MIKNIIKNAFEHFIQRILIKNVPMFSQKI